MQKILVFIACFFIWTVLAAQQYPFVSYTAQKDGLINNRGRFIFQDNKGRLFISTFGGLSIYDGSRFVNYSIENGLAANLVNGVVEMGNDSLWIILNTNRLFGFVNGKVKEIKTLDKYCPVINHLIKCSNGFYYAMADEGLYRFENNQFVKIPLDGITAPERHLNLGMGVEMDGKLFILYDKSVVTPSSGGLLVYDLLSKRAIAYQDSVYCNYLTLTPENEMWVCTAERTYKLDKSKLSKGKIGFSELPEQYQALRNITSARMFIDRQRNIWAVTLMGLTKFSAEGNIISYSKENGLPGHVTSIFQDRENNMWFTSRQNGIMKLSGASLEYYPELKPGFVVTNIFADPQTDSTWFLDGSKNRALLYSDEDRFGYYGIHGLDNISYQVVAGRKNYIFSGSTIYDWFPGRAGINVSRVYSTSPDNGFPSAILDPVGNLVAVSKELIVVTGKKIIRHPLEDLADQVTIDKENRIWVATRPLGFSCYKLTLTEKDTSLHLLKSFRDILPGFVSRSIATDANGNVWVGTRQQGLFCFFLDGLTVKSWIQVTTHQGLTENFIDYLYCDPDNTIWACSPGGLDKVILKDGKILVENVTTANNMLHTVLKIQSTRNGTHWVLTENGIIKIRKQEPVQNPVNPGLLFTGIQIGNEQVSYSSEKLSLHHAKNNLSFHIAAPTFVNENQTRFSYLLEGSGNSRWSDSTTNIEINFANLPPGDYTLKAKAIFLNGLYPDAESSYSFVIHPPWWKTWWFRILVGIIVLGVIILGLRFYYNQKLKRQLEFMERQKAIEKERTRIATDMHDDLGAGLSRIKFLSESIGIKKQQEQPIGEDISKIREYSHDMIDKMGEIVWALNEKNDSLSDLLSYTRAYAMEYLSQNGINCIIDAPEKFPDDFLSGELRRNMYLTVKEALHNVVKHANAEDVIIVIKINGHSLEFNISDNGKGFDQKNIRPFSNGLINMEKRMKDIGGKFSIKTDKGTAIGITIPLQS